MKKRFSFLILCFCMIFVILPLGASKVNALAVRTEAPDAGNPYYVHTSYGGLNECILIDSATGECIPNCVGYVWGRAYEFLGRRPSLSKSNANTFYTYNQNGGYYAYGSTPVAGSIACWDDGAYGHVAFVESVSENGVTITDSSFSGDRWRQSVKTFAQMQNYAGVLQGYIYLVDSAQTVVHITLNAMGGTPGTTDFYYHPYGTVFYADPACTKQLTAITPPVKDGYSFQHYYGDGSCGGWVEERYVYGNSTYAWMFGTFADDLTEDITRDATLYAKWTPIDYTISYDLGGGKPTAANPAFYTIEDGAITLNAPVREGYEFTGWIGTGLSFATKTATIPAGSTGDRYYTATWRALDTYGDVNGDGVIDISDITLLAKYVAGWNVTLGPET